MECVDTSSEFALTSSLDVLRNIFFFLIWIKMLNVVKNIKIKYIKANQSPGTQFLTNEQFYMKICFKLFYVELESRSRTTKKTLNKILKVNFV